MIGEIGTREYSRAMESISQPEAQERIPRGVTGLLVYSHPYFSSKALEERRAMDSAEEPMFAVCEYPVVHDEGGWREMTLVFNGMLDSDEADFLDVSRSRVVGRGEYTDLTDGMAPGEIRRVSKEEYHEAYLKKFGGAIQGPIFL